MINRQLYVIIALTLVGCISTLDLIKVPSNCICEIPREVEEYFDSQQNPKYGQRGSDKIESMSDGTHEDLYMIKEGVIASKKHGWRCNVKYSPSLMFENNNYIVVSVGSQADRIRYFSPIEGGWLVIRKSDGKIIRAYDVPKLNSYMEYNGILYVQTLDYAPIEPSEILCIKLSE